MEERPPLVLLADDDEQLGEMLMYMLNAKGYKAIRATDGEMALRMITDFQPDVVLLDIMMPKRNGYEVLRAIRANDILKKIKVVMFSVKSQSEDVLQAGKLGADLYLAKPVDPESLMTTIKVLLKKPDPSKNA
jgi:DNA-binding response OmpR family regulator